MAFRGAPPEGGGARSVAQSNDGSQFVAVLGVVRDRAANSGEGVCDRPDTRICLGASQCSLSNTRLTAVRERSPTDARGITKQT